MKPIESYLIETDSAVNAELHFVGGFKGDELDECSSVNGIYVAFACKENDDAYDCLRILYIGKAEGEDTITKRITDHYDGRDDSESGKQSVWKEKYCEEGEVVVYSYAEHEKDLFDIEAALIYRNQPLANIVGKDHYIGKSAYAYVKCTGEKGCLADTTKIMRLKRVYKK